MHLNLLLCRFHPTCTRCVSLTFAVKVSLAVFANVNHDGCGGIKVFAGVGDINIALSFLNFRFIFPSRPI
jgi:hypothetical protein